MEHEAESPARRFLIAPLLVLWTASLLVAHGYWMATYTGGVIQEDTAILTPAVQYVTYLQNQSWILRAWAENLGDAETRIATGFMLKKIVVAPYVWSFMVYPPLPSLATAVALAAGRDIPNAPFLPALVYLPLLVLGTYLLARRFMKREFAMLAAMLVPLLPGCFYLQRQLYAAYPMTVALTFVYWAWWRSDGLALRRRAALAGLFIGLLLLVKHTASVFLLLPAGWTLWRLIGDFRRHAENRRQRLTGSLLALFVALAVASVWYLTTGGRHLLFTMGLQSLRGVPPFEPLYYPRLVLLMAGRLVSALTISGLLALLIVRRMRRRTLDPAGRQRVWFIVLWMALPLIAFSFLPVINMEVTLPIMPAIVIILALLAEQLLPKKWAAPALGGLAAVLLAFFLTSLDVYGLDFNEQLYEPRIPGAETIHRETAKTVRQASAGLERPGIAFIPFADIYVGDKVFGYYAFLEGFDFRKSEYWFDASLCGRLYLDPADQAATAPENAPAPSPAEQEAETARLSARFAAPDTEELEQIQRALRYADVALIAERDKPLRDHEGWCLMAQATHRLLDDPSYRAAFSQVKTLAMPGGGRLLIYRRIDGPAPDPGIPLHVPGGAPEPPRPPDL